MKRIITIFILIALLPIKVKALTGNITISCKETLKLNEEVVCQIEGNTDEEVSSIHAVINTEDGLTIETVTKDTTWEGDNDKTLDLYTADNKKGPFKIATVKVKAAKAGTYNITVKDIALGDKNFEEHKLSNVSKKITIINDNTEPSSSSSKPSSSSSTSKPSSSSSLNPSASSPSNSSSSKPSSSSSTNIQPSSSNSTKPASSSTTKVDKDGNVTENPKTGNTIGFLVIMMSIAVALIVINKKRITDIFN